MDARPGPIRDYRDLIVWSEAMEVAELTYRLTEAYPSRELFGLTSQMRRAAVSIPSNIAEGFGRAQRKVFVQFLRIAQGSLKELETQAMLSRRLKLLPVEGSDELLERTQRLGRRLVQLIRSLERGIP